MKINAETSLSVHLWDISGQERCRGLSRVKSLICEYLAKIFQCYFKGASGAFVVFDITSEKSLRKAFEWKADIDQVLKIPVFLLANKVSRKFLIFSNVSKV
jgi:GTPase SAR1 family protein